MSSKRIIVTPEADLEDVLRQETEAELLAFGSPTRPACRPTGFELQRFHGFAFNDIAAPRDGLVPPCRTDIVRLLAAIRAAPVDCLVFQCWFGVSRSTAAAIIAAIALDGIAPEDAAASLREAAPWATPNPLMIALADAELGLRGELSEAVRRIGRGETAAGGRAFEWHR